jgi:hypothetical protein
VDRRFSGEPGEGEEVRRVAKRSVPTANLMAVSPVTSTVCSHDRGGKLQLSRIFEPSLVISL